jgi:hypothetical protein
MEDAKEELTAAEEQHTTAEQRHKKATAQLAALHDD